MESTDAAPKRCLIVVGSLGIGGAERQALRTALALKLAGVDVSVVACGPPYSILSSTEFANLAVERPPDGSGHWRQIRFLAALVESIRPDSVITFLTSAGLRFYLATLLSRPARCARFIASERGHYGAGSLVRHPITAVFRFLYLRAAHIVVVNSSALGANLFSFDPSLGTKVAVVPNILASDQPRALDSAGELRRLTGRTACSPLLLAIGSFQDARNHLLLAEAMPLVLARHPEAHLVVIGRNTGPECSEHWHRFTRRLKFLGVADHATITGELPCAARMIPEADVVVVPSKLEGSSNLIGEALLAGAAIAATPVSDAESLLGSAGCVATGWTPPALAAAVSEAVRRRDELRALSKARGLELAKSRSSAKIAMIWLTLLFS
jgi:glycosyltransferase involved in cell wall biosynthesis